MVMDQYCKKEGVRRTVMKLVCLLQRRNRSAYLQEGVPEVAFILTKRSLRLRFRDSESFSEYDVHIFSNSLLLDYFIVFSYYFCNFDVAIGVISYFPYKNNIFYRLDGCSVSNMFPNDVRFNTSYTNSNNSLRTQATVTRTHIVSIPVSLRTSTS